MSQPPILIAPSLLSCDFARIAEEVERVERAGADWLHVDVMDGHFVPNLTIGPPVVRSIADVASTPLDVHLMISEPARYAAAFAEAGASVLSFHVEVATGMGGQPGMGETIARLRDSGVPRVGVALCPATPIEAVADWLDELDLVLVMSVVPGFGGQSFMPEVLEKTRWLRERGYSGHVEMDGGLNAETIGACAAAGANALVSGSAIFGSGDIERTIGDFRERASEARTRGNAGV